MGKADEGHKPHANLPPGLERRTIPRFDCDRGVQCWKEGSLVAFYGSFDDLSMTGCSIQTTTPLPPGSRIRIVFTLFGTSIRVQGSVRSQNGNVMGIGFAGMVEGEQKKLAAALQRLADGADTGSEMIMNTQAAIQRLQRWFKMHDLLTRDLFERLVDGRYDPALGSNTSPMMDKAAANSAVDKVVSGFSRR